MIGRHMGVLLLALTALGLGLVWDDLPRLEYMGHLCLRQGTSKQGCGSDRGDAFPNIHMPLPSNLGCLYPFYGAYMGMEEAMSSLGE